MKLIKLFLLVSVTAAFATAAPQAGKPRFANYRHGYSEDILALQIQLDRLNFSCNRIDGCWGSRTEIAFRTWQSVSGLPETGIPTVEALDALGGGTNVLTTYIVSKSDLANLVVIPESWEARARLPGMKFSSVEEMLAEKGHCSEALLRRLNPRVKWPNPPMGTIVIIPDCKQTRATRVLQSDVLRISLSRMEITAFDADGKLIALFPCSIAKQKKHRPNGELSVRNVAANPHYLYDPQLFYPGTKETRKLNIPPGPNSPVGSAWIGLSLPGYGIHGTPYPNLIGQAASHGCFRLANWNAEKLMRMVSAGMPLVVEE
ncbi:MAG: murein L,D-transpeptidase [Kiritimatiellae bacterium]|nr:murein L,D-transpeptidase [Kiritimatiellia bacterium]